MAKFRNQTNRTRRGFTLIELMVAMTIGAITVTTMFTMAAASTKFFQNQQRVAQMQLSLRMAADRLRRDIMIAGLHGSPSAACENRQCPTIPSTTVCPGDTIAANADTRIRAVRVWNNEGAPTSGVGAATDPLPFQGLNNVEADRVRLVGNYVTGESYLIRSTTGTQITFQIDWLAYRRSFCNDNTCTTGFNAAEFDRAFVGRAVRIISPTGNVYYTTVSSAVPATSAAAFTASGEATISVSPALPVGSACLPGLGAGATITPLTAIEYRVEAPRAVDAPLLRGGLADVGTNRLLIREEFSALGSNPDRSAWNDATDTDDGNVAGTRRIVLDFLAHFNVNLVADTGLGLVTSGRRLPVFQILTGSATQLSNLDARLTFGARIELAARDPDMDPRLLWPAAWATQRPAASALIRYRAFNDRAGSSRVRMTTFEAMIPNVAMSGY